MRREIRDVFMRRSEIPGDATELFQGLPLTLIDEAGDIGFTADPATPNTPVGTTLVNIKHSKAMEGDAAQMDRYPDIYQAMLAMQAVQRKTRPDLECGIPFSHDHLDRLGSWRDRATLLLGQLKPFEEECTRLTYMKTITLTATELDDHIRALRTQAVARPLRSWMLFIALALERRDHVLAETAVRTVQTRILLAQMRGRASRQRSLITPNEVRRFNEDHMASLRSWHIDLARRFNNRMDNVGQLIDMGLPEDAVVALNEAALLFDQIGDTVLAAHSV